MIGHEFDKRLKKLDYSNKQLTNKLSTIIDNNFPVKLADLGQSKLSEFNVAKWKIRKAIPTNCVIQDAFSILLSTSQSEGHFFDLLLTKQEAKQILDDALIKYNKIIITDNLSEFKLKILNGRFDRVKKNPYSSKVTTNDIMGCIAYTVISGYLYNKNLGLNKHKKLNLSLYQRLISTSELSTLVNSKRLLRFLQKEIKQKGRIDINSLHKAALLYLLLTIKENRDCFFKS